MCERERKGEKICAYLHSIVHTRAIVEEMDGPMLEVTVSLTRAQAHVLGMFDVDTFTRMRSNIPRCSRNALWCAHRSPRELIAHVGAPIALSLSWFAYAPTSWRVPCRLEILHAFRTSNVPVYSCVTWRSHRSGRQTRRCLRYLAAADCPRLTNLSLPFANASRNLR